MRVVDVRVLPWQHHKGRYCRPVRIHWFIWDDEGPIQQPVNQTRFGPMGGSVHTGQIRGRIACQPKRDSALPERVGASIQPVVHTDDCRAATCPECLATEEYKKAMADYADTVDAVKGTQVPEK